MIEAFGAGMIGLGVNHRKVYEQMLMGERNPQGFGLDGSKDGLNLARDFFLF